jgi:hypothetical protein
MIQVQLEVHCPLSDFADSDGLSHVYHHVMPGPGPLQVGRIPDVVQ